jgi:hypothetical protein
MKRAIYLVAATHNSAHLQPPISARGNYASCRTAVSRLRTGGKPIINWGGGNIRYQLSERS